MSLRHLEKGSALPEVKPDVLRVYSMHFCPYAERTRLVVAHKNIPHEIVNVNLKNKPEWLFERNPLGLVPTIEYKGHHIYESAICDEFLEDEFPGNGSDALLPSCPFKRAAARLFMTVSDKKIATLYGIARADSPEKAQEEYAKWKEALQWFEDTLSRSGEPFFGGTHVGMADFHLWPFFERTSVYGSSHGLDLLPAAQFPRLAAWSAAMENIEAVKKCRVSPELHKRFFDSFMSGTPQYDLHLESGA